MSQEPSIAPSNVSVTRSQVSQVDFKLKANTTKMKLKSLLKNADVEKQGYVKQELFFELLELHGIKLDQSAVSYLKNNFRRNDMIHYKEAINQLTIDMQAAAGQEIDASDAKMKWTILPKQKPVQKEDAPQVFKDDASVKSAKSILSKDKLRLLEK